MKKFIAIFVLLMTITACSQQVTIDVSDLDDCVTDELDDACANESDLPLDDLEIDDEPNSEVKDDQQMSQTLDVSHLDLESLKGDTVTVHRPLPGDRVASPLTIIGEVPGPWFFEANFPITIKDGNGQVIAEGHGQTQSDWTTTNPVPFTAQISFKRPISTNDGVIILQKSNASDLPENDDSLEYPVKF